MSGHAQIVENIADVHAGSDCISIFPSLFSTSGPQNNDDDKSQWTPTVDRLTEFVGEYVDRLALLRYSVQVLFCIFHSRPQKYCNDEVKLCLCLTNQWAHGIFLQTKGKHESNSSTIIACKCGTDFLKSASTHERWWKVWCIRNRKHCHFKICLLFSKTKAFN